MARHRQDPKTLRGETARLEGRSLQAWLDQIEGDWRHIPSPDGLFILQRLDIPSLRDERGQVSLCGELAHQGELTDIINLIGNSRWTGELSHVRDESYKTISFRNGEVTGATSNAPEDRIGELSIRLGMLDRAQLDEALLDERSETRIGYRLMSRELITSHDLYVLIQRQVEEVFFSLLNLSSGHFFFVRQRTTAESTMPFMIPTQNLLMKGLQRIDEMSYFQEKIPSTSVIFERLGKKETPPPVSMQEAAFLELIDGQRDLETAAREGHFGEFEALKMAFRLMQAGLIRPLPVDNLGVEGHRAKQGGLAEVANLFNNVFASLYCEAEKNGRVSELRETVGSFFDANEAHRDVFHDIEIEPDGTLPVEQLVANISALGQDDEVEVLYQALNEFLFFQTFIAGETLDTTTEENLHARLDEILQSKEHNECAQKDEGGTNSTPPPIVLF
jgi:hypothetical protein